MNFVTYPSLKCQMGSWIYYVTCIKAVDIVKLVHFAHECFPENELDKVLQRRLTDRSLEIAAYLDLNEQRFFGSLILAAYDGEPNFIPINLPDAALLGELSPKPGLLRFDGTEKYYALDGQHRLAALQKVVKDKPERYAQDEISAIIVCHTRDDEGIKRARRLFTTLNRYAKKTSKAEDVMMDEDSPADIYTRRLVREHDFFRQRIKVSRKTRNGGMAFVSGESMPRGEKQHLMAFLTLKRCNEALLPKTFRDQITPQVLPSLDVLDDGYDQLTKRWNTLIDAVQVWSNLKDAKNQIDGDRGDSGGNVLLRPIAIVSFIEACGEALDAGISGAEIGRIAAALADISQPPWCHLLWNPNANKMYDGQVRRRATKELWRYYLGVEPNKEQVKAQWLSAIGQSSTSAHDIPSKESI
jgi:DNA sulfur modification protein DndB